MRFLSIVSLVCFFFIASCGKSPSPSTQALRMNIFTDPVTLDPRKARDLNAMTICRMLFEGLTRISKEGIPELALAERVEISEDGLQYTFYLRKSFWSNADLVTSYDFAESWRAILDPEFPTDIAHHLYVIQNAQKVKLGEMGVESLGVQTPNSSTLIVRLEQPTAYFLEVCATAPFLPVPQQIVRANPNWVMDQKSFVGNGPFCLKAWRHNDEIIVSKNEKYWEAKSVLLQEICLLMLSRETEIQMFEDEELDWAGSPLSTLPTDAIKNLKRIDQLKIGPLSGTHLLRVNTCEFTEGKLNILSLPEFRRALAYSIDRSAIVEHLLQGKQAPARSLVPPEMGLSEQGCFSDQNLEMIQALLKTSLKKMGMEKADMLSITLSFINKDHNLKIAQAIQKQWQTSLGIQIDLDGVESKVFNHRIKQKNYQLAIGSWVADFNDPINFLEVFKYKQGGSNNTFWEDAKYIELLDRSEVCRNQDERKQILQEAEQILMEQMPIIPLYHYTMNYLQSDHLSDVVLSPIGQIDLRWAHKNSAEPSHGMR